MRLSVIVPVYNVEKFLPRYLDSLLRQDLQAEEYEVICVNDGSPDGCGAILAEYGQKHPDIFKVITQENGGLSAARNTGMKVAQGEYITFIDSDDYVIDGAYRYLLDHFCAEQKPDVLHFQYRSVLTDGITLADPEAKPDGKILFDGDGVEAYNKDKLSCVWNKFFRRQFLQEHHIEFEILLFEDNLFNFCVFRCHPRLIIVSSSIVRYEQGNTGSIIHTRDKERVIVQLRDLHYLITLMNHYLEEVPELASAIEINLKNFHDTFSKKLCCIDLTHDEWSYHTRMLRPDNIPLLDDKKESTALGRLILWLTSHSLSSYFIYRLAYSFMTLWHDVGVRKLFIHS